MISSQRPEGQSNTNISAGQNLRPNPYVGPRSFRTGEMLFGRDVETRDLRDLLIAERIVLLYSPSGAGKSSLIQAALIPELEAEGFRVLPPVRVNREPPAGTISVALGGAGDSNMNRYVLSVLLSIEDEPPPNDQAPETGLSGMKLATYLERRRQAAGMDPEASEVLIFDQFEEILTTNPTDRAGKEAFFDQVSAALRDRRRWALFAFREDYLAALDPYLRWIPTRLDTTFRLDLLGAEAAREAIQRPARQAGVDFTDAAATKLVDDLRRVHVQKPDGTGQEQLGLYVEPVQLQVVCRGLWEKLPPTATRIVEDDVGGTGDVDAALATYYAESVAAVAGKTGVPERRIRDWFENKLIIGEGIRGQVLQGPDASQGLENKAIWALVDSYLVRAEQRRGATWFELAHDRLVEPVKKNNATWREAHFSLLQRQAWLWASQGQSAGLLIWGAELAKAKGWATEHQDELTDTEQEFLAMSQAMALNRATQPLQRQAALWESRGQPTGLLMQGAELAEAERWAAEHQDELTPTEQGFLATSRATQRTRRRNLFLVGGAVVALAVAFVLVGFFAIQANQAVEVANQAVEVANQAKAAAEAQRAKAEALGKITLSRQLAFQAPTLSNRPDLALLLDLEANRALETVTATDPSALTSTLAALPEARSALLDALQLHPYLSTFLSGHSAGVISVAFNPISSTHMLASGSDDFNVILWDMTTRRQRGQPLTGHTGSIRTLAFSPDGRTLASGSVDTNIILWDLSASPPTSHTLSGHNGGVYGLAFSPITSTRTLASASEDGNVILWDLSASPPTSQTLSPGHSDQVLSVAFSPDGKTLASGSVDTNIILWDVANPAHAKPIGSPLKGHKDRVFSLAFSPEGKMLASGSADTTVVLWDVANPAAPKPIGSPLKGHSDIVTSVIFSPDGRTLASGSFDKTIILWDVAGARRIDPYLTGHRDTVRSVAFSPDGKTLASGSDDHTVILWDLAARGQLNQPLLGHSDAVNSVAFSPDGRILASGSADTTIILWDVATHKPTGPPLRGHKGSVTSVAFSPDGKTLASGSVDTDTSIILWDVANPAAPKRLGPPLQGHTGAVKSLAFSPDGRTLASGSADKTIILWDAATHKQIGPPLTGHSGGVKSLAFSPDGKTLASGGDDKAIILWDIANPASPKQIGSPLTGHTGSVNSVAFSPDGKTLASGSADNTIILWDVASHQQRGITLTGHYGGVNSVAFSSDGRTLASGGDDKAIILWDITWSWTTYPPVAAWRSLYYQDGAIRSVAFSPDGKTLASGSADKSIILLGRGPLNLNQLFQPLTGHGNGVYSLAFSPDGRTLASGSYDRTVRLWDVANGKQLGQPLTGHGNGVYSLAFSPDGKTLASGSAETDTNLILWDLTTTPPTPKTLSGHTDRVFSVAFSPDGKTLASGSLDHTIILWDLTATPPTSQTLRGHSDGVYSLAFSPITEAKVLVSGSLDTNIILWDLTATPPTSQTLSPGHSDQVLSVAFSPDGKTLASGSVDRTIILWDVANPASPKRLGQPLSGLNGGVNSVAFSPDGKTLASGSDNRAFLLWEVATRKALSPLGEGEGNTFTGPTGHSGAVISVAFSPDGKTVASGSDDYNIFLWDVDPASWKARACTMANRNMTQEEWNEFMPPDTPYHKTCPNLPPGEGATLTTTPTPAAKP